MSTQSYDTVELVHPRLGVIKVNAHEAEEWIATRGCSPYGGEPAPTTTPASTAPAPEVIATPSVDATQDPATETASDAATKEAATEAPTGAKGKPAK